MLASNLLALLGYADRRDLTRSQGGRKLKRIINAKKKAPALKRPGRSQ